VNAFPDPRRALLDLLNIVPHVEPRDGEVEDLAELMTRERSRFESFIATHGRLRSFAEVHDSDPSTPLPTSLLAMINSPHFALIHANKMFCAAVLLSQRSETNRILGAIFNSPVQIGKTIHRSAVEPDILAGTYEPVPRDLLDAMAIELMRSRKKIARCGLCSRFFYQEWNKDKYCSPNCGSEARTKAQREWMKNKRAAKKTKKGRKKR
jgi:hypothetical protein